MISRRTLALAPGGDLGGSGQEPRSDKALFLSADWPWSSSAVCRSEAIDWWRFLLCGNQRPLLACSGQHMDRLSA